MAFGALVIVILVFAVFVRAIVLFLSFEECILF